MERRFLGKTGMNVSVLGFGGAEIGYQGVAQERVDRLLNAALDAGLNLIDTAECYPGSEELIGRAVGHRRDSFYLLTKCGHQAGLGAPEWSGELVGESIDRSLRLLRTDRVDLLQLHSCTKEVLEKGDVVRALQEAREAGKTRFIGYSGDSTDALYALNMGVFDTLQTSVSVADQECLELTLPEARRRGVGVIAKRPLGNVMWRRVSRPADYYVPYWERFKKLDYEFVRGADPVGTALRFTLSVPGVATAIVGTTEPTRWQENAAKLAGGALPPAEFEAIRGRWKEVAEADWVGQV